MSALGTVGLSIVEKPTPSGEAELVAACVAGDQAAQRALFRREYARVHATVYRILGPSRDQDDLVQETFIAAFRGLARFRGESRLSTWIDRIAVRVVFEHIRARGKTPVPLGIVDDEDAGLSVGVEVDAQAHARDGLRRLYAALGELVPEQRLAFALYSIDGRSIADVARLTNVSAVTAKLRIWRARRELMKHAAGDPVLKELVS
ncbi:MAG TPA: RNA polymerase sigma factor [Kofleriaceae bacterium]|nr:RNA polymerase sigma factor [Kofleriaceae bacterium]